MSNFITRARAEAMTATYRKEKDKILAPEYQGQDILPFCETFDRASFEKLLEQPDCTFIRVYLGMSDDLKVRIIAVGANSQNVDILPAKAAAQALGADGDGYIVEDGTRCPTTCPPPPGLNG